MTLLVNVWLGHMPCNIEPIPDSLLPLLTPLPADDASAAAATRRLAGAGDTGAGAGSDGHASADAQLAVRIGFDPTPGGTLFETNFGRGAPRHRLTLPLPPPPLFGCAGATARDAAACDQTPLSPHDTVSLRFDGGAGEGSARICAALRRAAPEKAPAAACEAALGPTGKRRRRDG